MYIKFAFKSVVLIVLLAIPLIFGAASSGYAGGPLPGPKDVGGPVLIGKAVDGFLNAVVVDPADDPLGVLLGVEDPFVVQYIVVTCKETQVLLGPAINSPSSSQQDLERTTAECVENDLGQLCIEGMIFENAVEDNSLLSECFPEAQEPFKDDLVITRVRSYINTRTAISAEITLQLRMEL